MNDMDEKALLQELELDPYADERGKLLALRVQPLRNRPSSDSFGSWADAKSHARNLFTFAQQALLYWSPERVEREALRRAADSPKPSVIAQEVQVFTFWHQRFVGVLAETLPSVPPLVQVENPYIRETKFYLERFEQMLLALERRAASAEARATDYRLRFDLGQVRAAVENSRVASAVVVAIQEALRSSEQEHFERIDLALATRLGPLLELQSRTQRDVDFIATYIGQEMVKGMLPAERVREVLVDLAKAAAVEALKALLLSLAGSL
jgi:hypothetical protein